MGKDSSADLILNNANVITCEPDKPKVEAVAVKGDRILLTGTNKEIEQFEGNKTRIIDCQHKTLIPGFIDAHCHFFSNVRKLFSLDFSPAAVQSIEDIKEAIRRKARFSPEGRWMSGSGYNEFYLAEKRHPTRKDLDEVAPRHPVILTHRSLHAVVLNSLALKLVGIGNETEEPEGGIIDRDLESGEPNGILFEMLEYVRSKINFPLSAAEMDWCVSEVSREYLSCGITSIGEATVTNDLEQWQTYRNLKQSGQLKSRICMMVGPDALSEFKGGGMATGYGDIDLKVGCLKIVLSQAKGELLPHQEDLNQKVLGASRAGFQVAIHAVEQNAVESAIIALEYAQSHFQQIDQRHRIEHCSECPPDLRERLNRLQAVVVTQPPFIYYNGERYLAQVPQETQQWLYPVKSLIGCGVIVAGSSDSPVVPINPLMGMYAAVTRQAESGQSVLVSERVSAYQALEMYTRNAAYASFEENIKGTIAPGKLADIVMLSADPLEVPSEQIKDILVEMTLVGGIPEYER